MGNAQSPATDPRFLSASRAFSKQELEDLRSLSVSLSAQSNSNGKFISQSVFQAYHGICGSLGERLYQLVTGEMNDDDKLTFESLIISKAKYERGTREDLEEFIYQLSDINGDGFVTRDDIEAVIDSIQRTVFPQNNNSETGANSENESMVVLLNTANFSKQEGDKFCISQSDFKNWCNLVPSVKRFLSSLLIPPDPGRPGFQVPTLNVPENLNRELIILNEEKAWHMSGALSQPETEEWHLLYHSSFNGLSFNTFLGNISTGDGPTVLIIKDTEGYIYGGFASQAWERHSDFYGDMKSFLFQLYPQASIFRPTGANHNLQWCAVNFSSDSIPNGIGFGGKANHFGLFISSNFDVGHTFACTTFNSPSLSKSSIIRPDVIECWGIQIKGLQNDKAEGVKGTVLERFKEDRNMLNMVGLANSSD